MRQQRSNSAYTIKFGRPQSVPEYSVPIESSSRRGSSADSFNNNWRRDSTAQHPYQECCYCQNPQTQLRKCSNCRVALYCSKECQRYSVPMQFRLKFDEPKVPCRLDWFCHKKECKLRNPTHFDKTAKSKVEWLKILGSDQLNSCIIDSFKLRCVDEVKITGRPLQRSEVSVKFTRYLQAVRGVHILPDWYQKIDLLKLRNESLFNYNIAAAAGKLPSELDQVEEEIAASGYSANWGLKNLRAVHEVVCGPILIGQSPEILPNII